MRPTLPSVLDTEIIFGERNGDSTKMTLNFSRSVGEGLPSPTHKMGDIEMRKEYRACLNPAILREDIEPRNNQCDYSSVLLQTIHHVF
jgi:hypothetical protein